MDAYIIDGVRSPVATFGGGLSAVRADDLAAHVLRELMKRHPGIDPAEVEEVILGCANQAGEDNRNVARMACLLAGYPVSVAAETVNRLCASGLSAVAASGRMLHLGEAELMIAGGVEQMTRSPWVISKSSSPFGRDAQMFDSSFGWRFINPLLKEAYGTDAMGETAENLAERDAISREDQDLFAYRSQLKAAAALQAGHFSEEIAPLTIANGRKGNVVFDTDEFIKPQTTPEILAGLRPAFRKGGTVTAGNSSGLNDGAAALLLASESGLRKHSLEPLCQIISVASTGVEPRIMGIGPVEASRKALSRAGIGWDQLDLIEINEAFAAQSLACIRAWGLADDDVRINPNGGAIAIGHPLGMSGARLVQTASLELIRRNGKYALVTLCIGVGQGLAMVLKSAR